ncbi:hypothetical protein SUGI_1024270 [Cryptomeria japonica]|nr:hypothetical protein SUGI_1024270 [Cryptomeria japonica]
MMKIGGSWNYSQVEFLRSEMGNERIDLKKTEKAAARHVTFFKLGKGLLKIRRSFPFCLTRMPGLSFFLFRWQCAMRMESSFAFSNKALLRLERVSDMPGRRFLYLFQTHENDKGIYVE